MQQLQAATKVYKEVLDSTAAKRESGWTESGNSLRGNKSQSSLTQMLTLNS